MERGRSGEAAVTGFTLIELLIVVAIIAILAAIAVPNFLEAQVRAKVSRAKSDMRAVGIALETYAIDHNAFPPEMGLYGVQFLYQITPPVAYITSVGMEDPFKPRATDGYVGEGWKSTYHYVSYDGPWQEGYAPGFKRKGAVISSFGPDGKQAQVEHYPYYYSHPESPLVGTWPYTFYKPPVHIYMLYDPTNGTKSWGGIGRAVGDLGCPQQLGG